MNTRHDNPLAGMIEEMVTDMTNIDESSPLCLQGDLTIREAADLKVALQQRVAQGGNVVINMESCNRIDTSVAQLLTVFAQDMDKSGRAVDWTGISAQMRQTFERLGLARIPGGT